MKENETAEQSCEQVSEFLEGLKKKFNSIQELIKIQGRDGNWNFDNYNQGLFNGMEMVLAIIEDREPAFRCCDEKDFLYHKTCKGNYGIQPIDGGLSKEQSAVLGEIMIKSGMFDFDGLMETDKMRNIIRENRKQQFITLRKCTTFNCDYNHAEVCFLKEDIDRTLYCEKLQCPGYNDPVGEQGTPGICSMPEPLFNEYLERMAKKNER